MVRFHAAYLGFWLLLAGAPELIEAAGTWRWPAGTVLAAGLIAWSARFVQAFVWITGARPMARADLEGRFAAVVAATAIQPPRVLRFRFTGGRIVNAFALPSSRQSTVVFTDDVLEQFEPDEITAIFAHEVAHLERYDRRRLRRHRVVVVPSSSARGSPLAFCPRGSPARFGDERVRVHTAPAAILPSRRDRSTTSLNS